MCWLFGTWAGRLRNAGSAGRPGEPALATRHRVGRRTWPRLLLELRPAGLNRIALLRDFLRRRHEGDTAAEAFFFVFGEKHNKTPWGSLRGD